MSNLSSFDRTEAIPPWAHDVEHSPRLVLVINVILRLSGNMSAVERPDKPDPIIKTSVFLKLLIYNKIAFNSQFAKLRLVIR